MTDAPVPDVPTELEENAYVRAVISAGNRSRNYIYFILILLVLTFTSIRNNYAPDWSAVRVGAYQDLYHCLQADDLQSKDCDELRTRAQRASLDISPGAKFESEDGGRELDLAGKMAEKLDLRIVGKLGRDPDFKQKNDLTLKEIALKIKSFVKKDIETYTIPIPLLGSHVDINDLWLVSGVVMLFLLYFLRASQEQEHRNISYILTLPDRKELGRRVVLNQVLTALTLHSHRFVRFVQFCIWLTPTFLYAWLLYLDSTTIDVGYILLPHNSSTLVEISAEFVVVLLVLYMNLRCFVSHRNVQGLIAQLETL